MADFNVERFLGEMNLDGYRPNLFEIIIPAGPLNSQSFALKAHAASLPSSTSGVASAYYFGRQIKFTGNRVFDNWTVTAYLDEDDVGSGNKHAFENWMTWINSHQNNRRMFDRPTITGNIQVKPYGKKENGPLATYTLMGAFPIDVSAVPLEWGQNDTIAEYSITWAYQYWIKNPGLAEM